MYLSGGEQQRIVIAAAKLANCEEFAAKLPDGYNSMIGEKRDADTGCFIKADKG